MSNYSKLIKHIAKISKVNQIISLSHWDFITNMKPGNSESRAEQISELTGIAHEMFISQEMENLIENVEQEKSTLQKFQLRNLNLIKASFQESLVIPTDLSIKFSKAASECEGVWRKAKQENDFTMLKPYLAKVIELTKETASLKAALLGLNKYDSLINIYDNGRKAEDIDKVFSRLKNILPQLILETEEKQKISPALPIKDIVNQDQQKELGMKIMENMGFDFNRGRLDISEHPCCIGISGDVRITTRYDESNFFSSLQGIIHETGHALYEFNLPKEHQYQPIGSALGMSIHESQSLIMEMQAARSFEFCEYLSKTLKDFLKLSGAEYSPENLYKISCRVKRDFIRVDADELTYPMHVILRYEIEKALINDEIKLEDIPGIWNEKMKTYLGLEVKEVKLGCLQDIHWPSGLFGYFPCYSLGAIIAAQLMQAAKKTFPSIDSELKEGVFTSLNNFLNTNVRNVGSLKTSSELIVDSTGSDINAETYLEYLKARYIMN